MKNIAFIVNPISGTRLKGRITKLIRELLDPQQFSPTVVTTEYAGHATQLAQHFALEGYYAVVAVGGDGTVNEVATGLVGSKTALGIIPNGSGNGLARHLDISTRMNRAIEMLNNSEAISVDYGMVNDKTFFSTCGTGFDAVVASQFNKGGTRGLGGYVHNIVDNIFQYTPDSYHIQADGIDFTTKALLINVANANQWGYNAYIAPKASIQDGWLDLVIIDNSPLIAAAELTFNYLSKHIHQEELQANILRVKEVVITRTNTTPIHIDGDPVEMPEELHFKIIEDGLKVLVKKRF
jgi:YegS/Rv2252/BmrU family lipid kinase